MNTDMLVNRTPRNVTRASYKSLAELLGEKTSNSNEPNYETELYKSASEARSNS